MNFLNVDGNIGIQFKVYVDELYDIIQEENFFL